MLNIAVVEDNDDLRGAMVAALEDQGHHVVGLDCAEAVSEQNAVLSIDLMVVDLNLPGEDGLSLSRRLRQVQPDIGIIMVTARSGLSDKTIGYESGADIYLTKPVSLDELGAAINALGRRLRPASPEATLVIDVHGLTLKSQQGGASLTAQEAAVLTSFVRAPDQRLEAWQLLEIFERTERASSRSAMNVAIFRLGKKLKQAGGSDRPFRAIRGWGYQLCERVTIV